MIAPLRTLFVPLVLAPLVIVALAAAPQGARDGALRTAPSGGGGGSGGAVLRSAPREPAASLETEVRRLVEAMGLKRAKVAVSIRDERGREIVSINASEPMLPASNMKLLSTGLALRILGPDFSFRTRILRDGSRLTVVGDGDPAFGDPELLGSMTFLDAEGRERAGADIETLLQLWVRPVVASGLKRIDELVVDDRIFEREYFHPLWPKDQLNERYCAQVCGLNFHLNRLHLYPRPGPGGRPDLSRVEPEAPFLQFRNRATTRNGKSDPNSVWIGRSPDRNDISVNGNVKQSFTDPVPVVVHDMPTIFGEILADRLRREGIVVDRVRLADPGDPPAQGEALGPVFRTPIRVAIERANTDSNNLHAEALLKRAAAKATGRPGSWTLASEALDEELRRVLGADASGFVCSDGSGLSRGNRVTARGMSLWLDSIARRDDSGIYLESLAVGGRSGTVRRRFIELDPATATVRCKTGYIAGVSTLTGVLERRDRRWTFSVLGNDLTEASAVAKVRQLQEQVVRAMIRAIDRSTPAPAPALGG